MLALSRRELFKGLAVTLAAASMPIPVESLAELPSKDVLAYLQRVRLDLINYILHPPMTTDEKGFLYALPVKPWEEALMHVNRCIREIEA